MHLLTKTTWEQKSCIVCIQQQVDNDIDMHLTGCPLRLAHKPNSHNQYTQVHKQCTCAHACKQLQDITKSHSQVKITRVDCNVWETYYFALTLQNSLDLTKISQNYKAGFILECTAFLHCSLTCAFPFLRSRASIRWMDINTLCSSMSWKRSISRAFHTHDIGFYWLSCSAWAFYHWAVAWILNGKAQVWIQPKDFLKNC